MAVVSSYSTLLTAVGDWLTRSDLSSFIPSFVQNFEERFYRQPENFASWMEIDLDDDIASNVIPVPSDYLALKYAYVDGSPATRLERVSIDQLYGRYPRGQTTGRPCWIARDAQNFVFGPNPDSTYTIKGVYWGKSVALRNYASDAAAHPLILNAPDLCLYGALAESAPFLRSDARLIMWKQLYNEALQDYRDLYSEEEISGSPSQEVLA